jgi:8-oxo-dGTP pyrophosphatase MutT (NUDIX family)
LQFISQREDYRHYNILKNYLTYLEEDVKKSLSNVPELTVKNGLKLHSLLKNEYAKILNNKVWAYTLNLGKEDKIPQIGTKTAGVGAVIFNKDGKKMLIVQEKANHLGGSRKYPTGSVKKNESLMAGLFREIQEEVSLAKKDLDVIGEAGYWETPGSGIYKDGCDIFHLYALKYKGEEKTIIYQKSELQDALWIDVDEFIKEKEKTYKPSAELIKVAKALNEGRLLKTSAKPVIIKGFEYMDLYIPEINNPDELFFEFGKYE